MKTSVDTFGYDMSPLISFAFIENWLKCVYACQDDTYEIMHGIVHYEVCPMIKICSFVFSGLSTS